jgi:hypothetical protein
MSNLIQFPKDILETIIRFCSKNDLRRLMRVSIVFTKLIRASNIWSKFEPIVYFMQSKSNIDNFCNLFKINFSLKLEDFSEYQKYNIKRLISDIKLVSLSDIIDDTENVKTLFNLTRKLYNQTLISGETIDKIYENLVINTLPNYRIFNYHIILNYISIDLLYDETIVIRIQYFEIAKIIISEKTIKIYDTVMKCTGVYQNELLKQFEDSRSLMEYIFPNKDYTYIVLISTLIYIILKN